MAELFTLVGKIAIDATVANQTIDGTMSLVGELNSNLQVVSQQADSTGKHIGSSSKLGAGSVFFGNMMTKLAAESMKLAKNVAQVGFEHNSTMESMKKSFSVYTESEKEADNLVQKLYEMAKITPLNLTSVGLGAKQLLAAGASAGETLEVLQMWGDVSLGDNNKFGSLVRAHSKILADERVMAKELNSMTDTGFPVRRYLADYLGINTGDLADKVKAGVIPSTTISEVLRDITSEGGPYFNKMSVMMETYDGQMEKLGDTSAQTAGALTEPFFALATSSILPKVNEGLSDLGTWASDHKEDIAEAASAIGDMAISLLNIGIDGTKGILGDADTTKAILELLPGAGAALASMKHPVLAALGYGTYAWKYNTSLEKKYGESSSFDEFISLMSKGNLSYSAEEKQRLQDWIDARRSYESFASDDENTYKNIFGARQWKTNEAYEQGMKLLSEMNKAESQVGLLTRQRYDLWLDYKDKEAGEDLGYLDVVVEISDDSEGNMQSQLDSMDLNATVDVNANLTPYYSAIASIRSNMIQGAMQGLSRLYYSVPDGVPSHAKGLDFVPRDGYLARLHYGEAVLNRSTADMLRNGGMGNTSRLEAAINRVEGLLQSIANNTSTGQTLALDTGVLVGQITPMIDRRLGTISNRKGRG